MGSSVFLGLSPRGGDGVPRPPDGTSYMCAHSMTNYHQILQGDQTTCEDFLQVQQRMLTHDLFALADFLVKLLGMECRIGVVRGETETG